MTSACDAVWAMPTTTLFDMNASPFSPRADAARGWFSRPSGATRAGDHQRDAARERERAHDGRNGHRVLRLLRRLDRTEVQTFSFVVYVKPWYAARRCPG
jgi:hypothetical protein